MARDSHGKLARTRWDIGQVLMPAHFQAGEEALSREASLRAGLGGPPIHGVADLVWDEAKLAQGSLALGSLLVVLPGGELVAVPGNATSTDLDLQASGSPRVMVYLHLRREPRKGKARELKLYERDPPELERVVHEVALSASESLDDARLVMKLGEFARGLDKIWRLDPGYVPPLLGLGASPFLADFLAELRRFLGEAHAELERQLLDTLFGGDARALVRRCQIEAAHVEMLLGDIEHGIHVHPYVLFQALRRFYVEVSYLAGTHPQPELGRYQHDDLGRCLRRLREAIARCLRYRPELSPHLEFVRQGELLLAAPLGDAILEAAEVYLLVQKARPDARIPLDGTKLASPQRLATVHTRALAGVGLERLAAPHFRHSFGPEVDFYRLVLGEEWGHVRRERAIALYHRRELGQARVALFWRGA